MASTFNTLGIDKLRFFTGEGHEITMQKMFSARWEIVPDDRVFSAFYKNPQGHFEISPSRDISYKLDPEHCSPDGNYIISEAVLLEANHFYDVSVRGVAGQKTVSLQDEYGQELASVVSNAGDVLSLTIVKVSENDMRVITKDDVTVRGSSWHRIRKFSVRTLRSSETKSMTDTSAKCRVIVDEPGIIRPSVTFARNAADEDFIFSHSLVRSSGGVVIPSEKDSFYRKIEDDAQTCTITNPYDIMFFGYKTVADGNEVRETNTLRLTLNDGERQVTECYSLLDFFRCSDQTSVEENLKTYTSYISPEKDVETFDDIIREGTTETSVLYGMTDALICEVLMSEFSQYDEELLDAMTKTVRKIYASPSLTDVQVLRLVLSTCRECGFEPEFWNDSAIVSIIRSAEPDAAGAAISVIDYALYGDGTEKTMAETVGRYTVAYNIPESQYPYVKYFGEVQQETVSEGLMSAQTIILVTDNGADSPDRYTYPVISDRTSPDSPVQYRMHFRFQKDSEMAFITMRDDSELETLDSLYALTPDEINLSGNVRETNALHFAVGFTSQTEGCYENSMGIFILNTETDEDDFIGIIRFRTQVEGEDSRYRTLFTNFGVPDPAFYPNLFKDANPGDEGTDWRKVNLKSKELILTYDQIFPYAGTYRALFNAVRFLGYTDIIFKEWYRIKDANDRSRYVAIQNYDSSTGKAIPGAVKNLGVDYASQDRQLKLNRLSMVYHLQEISEDGHEDGLKFKGYSFSIAGQKIWVPEENVPYRLALYTEKPGVLGGDWEKKDVMVVPGGNFHILVLTDGEGNPDYGNAVFRTSTRTTCVTGRSTSSLCILTQYGETELPEPFTVIDGVRYPFSYDPDDIPAVENIYEYRSDEVLAKLYSVKTWLEDHVTGVGCYISDINGERIVLERLKTVGYATEHEVKDITGEGKFTPNCRVRTHAIPDGSVGDDVFENSSVTLVCSLNEFRSVTFEDYADYPIERFIRWKYDPSTRTYGPEQVRTNVGGTEVTLPLYVSAPLNALTVADEYSFEVDTGRLASGSLYEFADADCKDNPVLVEDGEIKFFDDRKTFSSFSAGTKASSSGKCPVIQVNKGNIRSLDGDWSPKSADCNILWSIYTVRQLTPEGGEENMYTYMKNLADPTRTFTFKGCVNLSPVEPECALTYTSDNKWHLPLFTAMGYKATNQMRGEADRTGLRAFDELDPNRTYVLEVLEGRMLFSNVRNPESEAECETAELIIREPEITPPDEQDIFVSYTYASERKPIYTFDTEGFAEDAAAGPLSSEGDFYTLADARVSLNTEVEIPVNRLASYGVTVKAYDAYNNMFTGRSDDKCRVDVRMPSIEVIVNQEDSGNSPQFYRGNEKGRPLTRGEKAALAASLSPKPEFLKTWRIYGAEHDGEEPLITYENVTYAIDTPKKDDYIILSNLTERAVNAETSGGDVRVTMDPANPGKQNIYSDSVTLCVYDDSMREVLAMCEGVPVKSKRAGEYVTVSADDLSDELKSLLGKASDPTDDVTLYVINSTEAEITGMRVDREQMKTIVTVGGAYANLFGEDTMVKVRVYSEDRERGTSEFINETAFRISGLLYGGAGYVIDGIIDGNFLDTLRNRNIYFREEASQSDMNTYALDPLRFTLSPLHSVPVQYVIRATSDGREMMYRYGTYFHGSKVKVRYNPRSLLFDTYFDDTYAMSTGKFEPLDAKRAWRDLAAKVAEPQYGLYVYRNHPVTVQKNRNVIVRPGTDMTQLREGFRTLWRWRAYAVEDTSNWPEHDPDKTKSLMFEVRNDVLSVSPDMLGPQFIELACTDVYGNVIRNSGGGNVFVDSETEFSSPSTVRK